MPKIGFVLINMQDISGSGGAERFIIDFVHDCNLQKGELHPFYIISDSKEAILAYQSDFQENRIISIHIPNFQRIRKFTSKIPIIRGLVYYTTQYLQYLPSISRLKEFKTIHFCLYNNRQFEWIQLIHKYTKCSISIGLVDCRIPYFYPTDTSDEFDVCNSRNWKRLFTSNIPIQYFSYYTAMIHFSEQFIKNSKYKIAIFSNRYFIGKELQIQKQDCIVWAGRLDKQKNPEYILDALLTSNLQTELKNWHIELYGKGPLQGIIQEKITRLQKLGYSIELLFDSNMQGIFSRSRIFISTQSFDNYPSRALAEAMWQENAVLASNEGSTSTYVRTNRNGYVFDLNDSNTFISNLKSLIQAEENIQEFGIESKLLLQSEFKFEQFYSDFLQYSIA